RPNIRSMSKLRAKYDTLRGHAQRSRAGTPSAAERQYQISAERHERITQGQFGPRPEIENDPALWMPRQIEEA
ncbi:hypothetical protein ACP3WA_26775, partial [Salmonella enterica]|uniref:hypothetical protein n=1 Tax=Salmonella enterica TaxID=28901 RepID=UPI003CF03B1D